VGEWVLCIGGMPVSDRLLHCLLRFDWFPVVNVVFAGCPVLLVAAAYSFLFCLQNVTYLTLLSSVGANNLIVC
jgi:hypothetical protein